MNAHLCQIEPNFHNQCIISVALSFIYWDLQYEVDKNMDNKLDEQLISTQDLMDDNKEDTDDLKKKLNKHNSGFYEIKTLIKQIMVQNLHYSPEQKDLPNSQGFCTLVPANNKAPPLEGRHYMKIGGMWTLKHEFSSQKIYQTLIKT